MMITDITPTTDTVMFRRATAKLIIMHSKVNTVTVINGVCHRVNMATIINGICRREARLADLCRQHPDVRIATAKDGRFQLMFMGIFGLVFVIGGILVFIFTVQEGEVTKDFFAHAESVSGTLLSSHSRKVGKKHRTTVYDVTYAYRYNDMEYMGQETLSSSEARSLSVTEASSSGNNIIVYVDTRNPSSSRVYHGSGEPLYFILIFPVIGVAVVIWGIHEYQNCKKGKVAVYKRRGKTVFVNIGR